MRQCGDCTLCCTVAGVEPLGKPAYSKCPNCSGNGCAIQDFKPRVCQDFNCGWITDNDLPDECRPDKVHFYVSGNFRDEYLKIMVDEKYPLAAKDHPVVEHYRGLGYHILIVVHDAVLFLCGHGRERPKKLLLDWNL